MPLISRSDFTNHRQHPWAKRLAPCAASSSHTPNLFFLHSTSHTAVKIDRIHTKGKFKLPWSTLIAVFFTTASVAQLYSGVLLNLLRAHLVLEKLDVQAKRGLWNIKSETLKNWAEPWQLSILLYEIFCRPSQGRNYLKATFSAISSIQ